MREALSHLQGKAACATIVALTCLLALPSQAGAASQQRRCSCSRDLRHLRAAEPTPRHCKINHQLREGGLPACPRRRSPANPRKLAAQRAELLFSALKATFYIPRTGLFRESLRATEPSFLWPFSQGFGATVAVAALPGQLSLLKPILFAEMGGLQTYVSNKVPAAVASRLALQSLPHFAATVSALGEGEAAYYDDNDWVGLELVRLYLLTHEESALAMAEEVMQFEMSGWDPSSSLPCPGGIPHSTEGERVNRSAISTAPAAELGVILYRLTGSGAYLQFAEQGYEWVRTCLRGPEGLYFDHIEEDGEVDPELWSYTQGVMIGAGTLLYEATGQEAYLREAEETARASLARFPLEQLAVENPFFVQIYLRNLLYLDTLIHSRAAREAIERYLAWAWENLQEPNHLILSADGSPTVLLGQAAYVQLYAALALPRRLYL